MPIFSSIEPQVTALRAPSEPSGFEQNLRHDEQRDAARALRRAFDARQHEMDDVLGEVVLAGRDEDLGAGDLVAAVGLLHRLGAQQARGPCRNAARSGSSCRSSRRRSSSADRLPSARPSRARCSAAIAPCVSPGYIAKAMLAEHRNSLTICVMTHRQALAAEFRRRRDADPAAFDDLLEGVLETRRRGHAAVALALAAFLVADAIERRAAPPRRTWRPRRGSPRPRRARRRRSPADWRSARCGRRRSAGTARHRRAPCRSA